jgi:hypothetical protein
MSSPDPILAKVLPPEAPPADDGAEEAQAMATSILRAERRLKLLEELAEIGMDMTRALARRSASGVDDPAVVLAPEMPLAEAAGAFAKLSRSVRLTLDLHARLDEALRALRAGEVAARKARREAREHSAAQAENRRAAAARDKVIEQVAMVITRESESEEEYGELLDALEERLADDLRWTEHGWPEDPAEVFGARPPWSPFNRVSRTPILAAETSP